ncbi:MAG: cupin domain-containing protein [Candidatus Eisenbacteria bacterium]
MKRTSRAALVLFAIGCWTVLPGRPALADHTLVGPADLKWEDVSSLPKGAKLAVIEGPMSEAVPFTVRIKLPANYRIPPHWHPAVERVTVLSGTLHMGLGDTFDRTKSSAVPVGGVMIMQPNTNHFAWTRRATVIQLHGTGPWGITYVNPEDDPRKK